MFRHFCEHIPVANVSFQHVLNTWNISHCTTCVALNCKFSVSCFVLQVVTSLLHQMQIIIPLSCMMQQMNCGTNLHVLCLVNKLAMLMFLV
jgi:hypothetical protein